MLFFISIILFVVFLNLLQRFHPATWNGTYGTKHFSSDCFIALLLTILTIYLM